MKYLKQIMALVVLLASVGTLKAYDFEYEGIAYNILSTTEMTCAVASKEEKYAGEITIPETVEYMGRTLKVTALDGRDYDDYEKDGCFENCASLTKVNLPNSLTTINGYCFSDCTALKEIVIPSSVSGEIGYLAFAGCSSLTSINIPENVTELGGACFASCISLKSIELPTSLCYIGDKCFQYCSSLESIQLPSRINCLNSECFRECTSLKSINIPKGVTEISFACFLGCTSLESIDIPERVTSIGQYCFSRCTSLKSLTIPNAICGDFFLSKCTSLKSLIYGGRVNANTFSESSLTSLTLRNTVTCISDISCLEELPLLELIIEDGNDNIIIYESDDYLTLPDLEYLYLGRDIDVVLRISNIKYITWGSNIRNLRQYYKYCHNLDRIQSNSTIPPYCQDDYFTNKQYASIEVLVPAEYVDAYKQAKGWKNFWNIKGISQSGIDDVTANTSDKVEVGRFDIMGRPVSDSFKGIIIIKYSDGSTDKIYQAK